MKVIIYGATGMVGQGVLRETLVSSEVDAVLTIGRRPSGHPHAKVKELVRTDLTAYDDLGEELRGWDACFFCLGQASAGMKEDDYVRVTYDITLAAAKALAKINPHMTFIYVSGVGADPTGRSKRMWARIRGRVENDLETAGFEKTFVFRPGAIEPQDGIVSNTPSYRMLYGLAKPILPTLRHLFPNRISSTRIVGRAMIAVARDGYPKRVLEAGDFLRASMRL